MSGLLVGRCYGLRLRSTQRELLIALADHADDFGNNVKPSVAYLAWKLDCNRSTVQRNLRVLQEIGESAPGANDGLLQLVREATPVSPREYRIAIDRGPAKAPYEPARRGADAAAERGPQNAAPQNAAPPQSEQEGGRTAMRPKPSKEPPQVGGGSAPARDDDQPPADFPDELMPHLRAVYRKLRDLAERHGARKVSALSLGHVLMARPRKPLVRAAHDYAAWADGQAQRRRDVVAGYRNWLDRVNDLAAVEPLDGDTPAAAPSPASGAAPAVRGGALRAFAQQRAEGTTP